MQDTEGLELILNAAESSLQIIVRDRGQLLCVQEWHKTDRATEILAPALQDIQASLALDWDRLQRLACVHGPGSFTGIRLVLTTCAALRRTTGALAAGLDYMQALALSAALRLRLPASSPVHVLTHARRNLVHYQAFTSTGPQGSVLPLAAVELLPPAEALQRALARPGHLCGSGLARNAALLTDADGAPLADLAACTLLPELHTPSAEALCLLADHAAYSAQDVAPFYVRPCDAVENLPQLAVRQGLGAAEAVEALTTMLERRPESEI